MKFSVSDLPFGSFSKAFLKALPMQYDIEIFMNSVPTITGTMC